MIHGIGTDIIEIKRIKDAVDRKGERFLKRIFTKAEIVYCYSRKNPFPSLAARFAAKEAVLKALGTGIGTCRWTDVEISRVGAAPPEVVLHDNAGKLARAGGIVKVLISISHDRKRAVAFALAVKGGGSGEGGYCRADERD